MRGPVFYIAADRTEEDVQELLTYVGVPLDLFPWMALSGTSYLRNVKSVLNLVPKGTKLVVLEGIATLAEENQTNGGYGTTYGFIQDIITMSKLHGYAVLGSVHATKTKEGAKFENPRQRILGSVGWAAFSGNIFLIEPDKPNEASDGNRTLMVLKRIGRGETHLLQFSDEGILVPRQDAPEEAKKLSLLAKLPNSSVFTRAQAIEAAKDLIVADVTVDRWLKGMVSDGYIAKTEKKGEYIRALPTFEGSNLLGKKEGPPAEGTVTLLSEENRAD